jgi:hypothetical protein
MFLVMEVTTAIHETFGLGVSGVILLSYLPTSLLDQVPGGIHTVIANPGVSFFVYYYLHRMRPAGHVIYWYLNK